MIIIARHGETQWNLAKRKQGRKDSPLTLRGVNQGIALGEFLSSKYSSVDKVLSSPLPRVRQYTSILVDTLKISYDAVRFEDSLAEHSFGNWEGMTDEDIELGYPGFLSERMEDWWNYVVPMGESYRLVELRVQPLLEDLLTSEEQYVVLVVCHEMVSKVLRKLYLQLSEKEGLRLNHNHDQVFVLQEGACNQFYFC